MGSKNKYGKERMPKLTKKMEGGKKFNPENKIKVGNLLDPKEEKLLIEITASLLKSNNRIRDAFRLLMKESAKTSGKLREYIQYKYKNKEEKVLDFNKKAEILSKNITLNEATELLKNAIKELNVK